MVAKRLMVQATGLGTGCGKSFVVALLCKLFREDGYRVAPFKPLNLTPVTYVNEDGKEFGYAQALQARASGEEPDCKMNPCTVKPLGDGKFDIFLEGECVRKNYNPKTQFLKAIFKKILGFRESFEEIKSAIRKCLESLLREYDIVCIEGSGPAKLLGLGPLSELLEIANMWTVKIADAPVILVTDSFDSVIGTLYFLNPEERRIVKGVILNKFRSDEFLRMGIEERYINLGIKRLKSVYQERIGKEIVGVLPYFPELAELPELDPITPSQKIPFDMWERVIDKISKKARKYIDMDRVYEIMG